MTLAVIAVEGSGRGERAALLTQDALLHPSKESGQGLGWRAGINVGMGASSLFLVAAIYLGKIAGSLCGGTELNWSF